MEIYLFIFILVTVVALFAFSMSESKGKNSHHARGKKHQANAYQNATHNNPDNADSNQQLS
ncbi:hypothetical protein ISG33_01145 [Glaciecola sp. MH2013]|uniref:hypothetical protein n=1 Tax=Glaciecola sp. MH2013 TaxID=2785524 RepID=UPI00189F4BA1|nr:hypothetical protein [Glaciecola sp. MH2013]MBF7072005.1 hypothetical protein [Glaciecola sp. MH2013]